MISNDYRESHKSETKALTYHQQFELNPYRSMLWLLEKNIINEIVKENFSTTSGVHLDFACGTGRITKLFNDAGWKSTGTDISSSMLKIAKENCKGVNYLEADLTESDILKGKKFDVITVFRFFPNAQISLRESVMKILAEKIQENGILIFNNHKNSSSIMYRLGGLIRKNQHSMSEREVFDLLEKSHLKVIDIKHVGIVPATNKYRFLPIKLIYLIEKKISKLNRCSDLSSNKIYVCKKVDVS